MGLAHKTTPRTVANKGERRRGGIANNNDRGLHARLCSQKKAHHRLEATYWTLGPIEKALRELWSGGLSWNVKGLGTERNQEDAG